jgi:hypothetical protein
MREKDCSVAPSTLSVVGARLDELDVAEMAADEASLPPAPWKLWTSCSFRRIGGATGNDGDVLSAYAQRPDGHPDLSMPERQLAALVRLRNALPSLLRYARLGVARERHGLAEFGPTGEMLFQPPADVIAEQAVAEALRASEPQPTAEGRRDTSETQPSPTTTRTPATMAGETEMEDQSEDICPCGNQPVLMDVNLIPLCRACADACKYAPDEGEAIH